MKRKPFFLWLVVLVMMLTTAACRNNQEPLPAPEQTTTDAVAPAFVSETQPQPGETQTASEPPPLTEPATDMGIVSEPTPLPSPEQITESGGTAPEITSISTQHTVQEREWLYQIARCYGASPQEIAAVNRLPHPGWIMAGEVWTIPNVGSAGTPVGPPCLIYYTVQQGDTLLSIAGRYKIPLDMLMFANYGCYGYNAHDDAWYYPLGTAPYGGYNYGCYYTGYPTIYPGNLLVIPVIAENSHMRP